MPSGKVLELNCERLRQMNARFACRRFGLRLETLIPHGFALLFLPIIIRFGVPCAGSWNAQMRLVPW